MSLNEFLTWLLSGGGSIIAASWILERIKWFQDKEAQVKEYIFFGLSAFISVAAYAITNYVPQHILTVIAPYFLIVSGVFAISILGKAFHKVDKSNKAQG